MKRGTVVALVILALFAGLLLWSTLSSQRAECTVCVEFDGRRNCATASASDEQEAARSAQSTACGPVARGMDASIACSNRPPSTRQCRTR